MYIYILENPNSANLSSFSTHNSTQKYICLLVLNNSSLNAFKLYLQQLLHVYFFYKSDDVGSPVKC